MTGLTGHFWDPGRGVGTRWVWDGGSDGVGTGGVGMGRDRAGTESGRGPVNLGRRLAKSKKKQYIPVSIFIGFAFFHK